MPGKRNKALILPENQQRAYDASLVAHKKACSLAYKLGGGRLNDPPKRKEVTGLPAARRAFRS